MKEINILVLPFKYKASNISFMHVWSNFMHAEYHEYILRRRPLVYLLIKEKDAINIYFIYVESFNITKHKTSAFLG
jgi:hypothetical protein